MSGATITIDFIDGLPSLAGKTSILVVDRLSKSAHFLALSLPYTTKLVAETFIAGIVKLHGMPQSIVSDRDPICISYFLREFLKLSGTQLKMSSAYHPQTDGQTEVVNRCIEQYLHCFAYQQPRKWHSFLPWAEFWYNTTYHSSTGMTPFQALYGRLPPTIPQYTEAICIQKGLSKACKQFYGLYPVVKKIGNVAYELELPHYSRIHQVFHVSLLKKKVGEQITTHTDLPPVSDDGELLLEPESILDTRWVKRGSKFIEESLVQWKQLSLDDATWENTQDLRDRFMNLNLEDKVCIIEGSIDKPRRSVRVAVKNPKYLD
ncbi:hypothetical protein D5086_032917 [Populus alba]|uniref:Uncharacterized protein n=1 Tax=Populus alba TaxID=43335 RepID=A0ACC4AFE2_POPAL